METFSSSHPTNMKTFFLLLLFALSVYQTEACICSKYKGSIKNYVKSEFQDANFIYLAKYISLDSSQAQKTIRGGYIDLIHDWKRNIKDGDKIGRIPNSKGQLLITSCDRVAQTNLTYLEINSHKSFLQCSIRLIIPEKDISLIKIMSLKQLERYVIKRIRKSKRQ